MTIVSGRGYLGKMGESPTSGSRSWLEWFGKQLLKLRWLILISLVLFAIFGSFFGALGLVGDYWPVLLIVLGLLMLVRRLFRPR